MASYVLINFDRTPPTIQIYAPRFTIRDIVNTITIESNEPLGEYQDIYMIDGNGTRHNLTFHRASPTRYVGEISFGNNIPIGLVQVFARMKDEVDNFSNVMSSTIEIKTSIVTVFGKVYDKSNIVKSTDKNRSNIAVKDKGGNVKVYDDIRGD